MATSHIPEVEELTPLPKPNTSVGTHLLTRVRLLLSPLRMLAALFLAPLLLMVAILSFPLVLVDFGLFRLRDTRAGHPAPKGLWEF